MQIHRLTASFYETAKKLFFFFNVIILCWWSFFFFPMQGKQAYTVLPHV